MIVLTQLGWNVEDENGDDIGVAIGVIITFTINNFYEIY